jgi:spore coat polysaccharide biosynthesis protein SpsF
VILGVLQARMSSSRLPGKVLAPVLGEPMLGRQVERLRRSRRLDRLVLATSMEASDDPVADYAAQIGLDVVRGSLADVLDRFAQALAAHPQTKVLVRFTADCPLADWRVVDAAVDRHLEAGADYTDDTLGGKTFPHGLDVEAVAPATLRAAAAEATDPYEREHVTPFIYRRPERFRLAWIVRTPSLAHLRWTVDYPEDLDFVRHVYETLYPADPDFDTEAVAALPWNSSRAQA